MQRLFLAISVLTLLLATVLFAPPSRAETLVWGTTSFPPGYITEGPDKGKGYADLLEQFMREKLPQYEHIIVESPNWERQLRMMRQGPLVCTSILFYRPPEDRATLKGSYILSAPNSVFFLHDVVVHKDNRHLFGDEVSFAKLLQNQDLTFGYNRPYGVVYDQILADYIGIPDDVAFDALESVTRNTYLTSRKNIFVRNGANMIDGMLEMLRRKRVDYILEYEVMSRYYQHQEGRAQDLVAIPVTEVKNKVNLTAFACSDTPEGEKAIAAINSVLKKYRETDAFKKTLSLLIPSGRDDLYWREYEKILNIDE